MAKRRLFNVEIWDNPKFRKIPAIYKAFFLYLYGACDPAGLWQIDMDLVTFKVGEKIDLKEALKHFGDEVRLLDGETMLVLSNFCEMNYCAEDGSRLLSTKSGPHKKATALLRSQTIKGKDLLTTLKYGLFTPKDTLKDKDKNKDKDKDKEMDTTKDINEETPSSESSSFKKDINDISKNGNLINVLSEDWDFLGFWCKEYGISQESMNKHIDNYKEVMGTRKDVNINTIKPDFIQWLKEMLVT